MVENVEGFAPMSGPVHGRRHAFDIIRRNFALVRNQKPVIESMVASGDTIALLVREHGVLVTSGEAYGMRAAQWFTFEGGKLRKICVLG